MTVQELIQQLQEMVQVDPSIMHHRVVMDDGNMERSMYSPIEYIGVAHTTMCVALVTDHRSTLIRWYEDPRMQRQRMRNFLHGDR